MRINDRRRSRGFWPSKGKGKGSFKGSRKGSSKGGKEELLAKIARTHCKICGAIGHWKAECPQRRDASNKEPINVVQSVDVMDNQSDLPQVIFEEMPEDSRSLVEVCLHVHGFCTGSKGCIRPHVQQAACNFWSLVLADHGLSMCVCRSSAGCSLKTKLHSFKWILDSAWS